MQSFEALLSLFVFVTVLACVLSSDPGQKPLDDSLYRFQLADDAWRVLYLRGDLRDFGEWKRGAVEADMAEIGDQTGLCLFIHGVEFTNCRDGQAHEAVASLSRTVITGGSPEKVTFTLSR
ncbi:MAG: hypothetical protein V1827_00535 [Candidatus Micrarchaeota archaeon]